MYGFVAIGDGLLVVLPLLPDGSAENIGGGTSWIDADDFVANGDRLVVLLPIEPGDGGPHGVGKGPLRSSSIQAVAEPTEAPGNGGFKRIAIPRSSIALSESSLDNTG